MDDDTFNSTKPSIDNEGSDNVVEPTYIPQEPRDYASNVTTDAAVTYVPLDELCDYDDISIQSAQDNELEPRTSDPAQRQSEDMNFVHSTEPSKRRKLDMGD